MTTRMLAFFAAALALAAPLAAEIQPSVQPGGDIPAKFQPVLAQPIPKGGDIPAAFKPPRQAFDFERREAMIPMRDGVKLYTAIVLPRNARNAPILLDRTPYSAKKATSRAGAGPWPESILTPAYAELVRAGYIIVIQDVRGKYDSEGDYVMNRPLSGPLNTTGIDHSTDAYDSIGWLVENVLESNRRVGTIGTSYN
ncbi:MAG: CocE/NonD family hydrolase, partial [Sphingomicrobium sp.]